MKSIDSKEGRILWFNEYVDEFNKIYIHIFRIFPRKKIERKRLFGPT